MIFAIYMLLKAMHFWKFASSRWYVVVSWIVWTGAPFVSTLLPTRFFIAASGQSSIVLRSLTDDIQEVLLQQQETTRLAQECLEWWNRADDAEQTIDNLVNRVC